MHQYTQSDEITLVLTDYATITTDAWFGYNIQKMCSVSASMATLAFSNAYAAELWKNFPEAMCSSDNGTNKYIETLVAKMGSGFVQAIFIPYGITYSDDATGVRNGGIGSTDSKA